MPQFPIYRPRRLRGSEPLRALVREAHVDVSDLIYPLFAIPGAGLRREIPAMPGVAQTSVDELVREAEQAYRVGVPAVLLFGIPPEKDEVGSTAYADGGIVQTAVRALKREMPELVVITDVCLCEYTSHGHCGVLRNDEVDNDATLPILGRVAASHAAAGADIIAPSDMMDGRVGAIRRALDESGFAEKPIMSYSVKYASAFYGPFRDVAESAPAFGDRRAYQMDPANVEEALREASLDIAEGADILMVKPALPYLDVIGRVKRETGYPLCAYQVSGEYAMLVAAAERGWVDLPRAMEETLTAIRRAGADMIITYYARRLAEDRWA